MDLFYSIPTKISGIFLGVVTGGASAAAGLDAGMISGWGFAVTVTYFLYKQLLDEKEQSRIEREKNEEERERHYKQLDSERDASDRRHEAAIDFTRECTLELVRIREALDRETRRARRQRDADQGTFYDPSQAGVDPDYPSHLPKDSAVHIKPLNRDS
jgi:glycine/D-amino acid oxidase-like deaminating enzyme